MNAILWDRPSVFVVCQLLLLCCVALAAVSPSAAQQDKRTSSPLKIGFQNSPPYQFPDAAGLPTGPAVELMRAAAAREGIRLEWALAPNEALTVLASHRAVMYQVVLACDCQSRHFVERDAANLGTDPSVPRRRFCAAWGVPSGPGSVPGFTHGARIAAARSHSLFNPAKPEAALIGALWALTGTFAAMVWLVRRLPVARRRAEAGNRAKSEFLANMSHESKCSLLALADQVEQHAGHEPDHSPARVLVADHNAANRRAAVRMLESLGLRADETANGREAVDMLRLLPYDLVLMDCQMPFMNGQEAATEIRKREPPDRRTPIVAMTAETGADCLDDCLASGMDDILLKPVRREKLMATLHRWLPAGHEKHLPVGGTAG
jgi:CheY-like chemotaxis protein